MEKNKMSTQLMYKPLPDSLTIKTSKVDGLGLFAKEGIGQGTNLGMCHLELGQLTIRTPLGGFINHSQDANCVKVKLLLTRQEWNHRSDLPNVDYNVDFKKWNLVTLQDIKEGLSRSEEGGDKLNLNGIGIIRMINESSHRCSNDS